MDLTLALCRNVDPDLFFPIGSVSKTDLAQAEEAKALCVLCPIKDECLQDALDRNIEFGVYGGTSEKERRAMKRREAEAVWA